MWYKSENFIFVKLNPIITNIWIKIYLKKKQGNYFEGRFRIDFSLSTFNEGRVPEFVFARKEPNFRVKFERNDVLLERRDKVMIQSRVVDEFDMIGSAGVNGR